jgi:hypothetical protein
MREVENRAEVLWDTRRRFPPRFSTEQDEHVLYIDYTPSDGDSDADAAFAQRLEDSINEKDPAAGLTPAAGVAFPRVGLALCGVTPQ